MKTHDLKTWPIFYEAVKSGEKNFEIRENDRDFQVGDILRLREWNPNESKYTGRACYRRVTYMTDFAQKPRFVVMALTSAPPIALYQYCGKPDRAFGESLKKQQAKEAQGLIP